jgi:hypothetical protein
MPETAHVRASIAAPATTLTLSLEYPWALAVYDALVEEGVVEANAEFAAALEPSALAADLAAMCDATPGYLEALAGQLQATLNDVAMNDVCTFVEAMDSAGTPEEIGAAAWELIMGVYMRVTDPGARPQESSYSCIEVCVALPGQECPPPT